MALTEQTVNMYACKLNTQKDTEGGAVLFWTFEFN